jgi:hypothetical protein
MLHTALTVGISPTTRSSQNPAFSAGQPTTFLPTSDLQRAFDDWILDCEYRLQSPQTLAVRKTFLKNLLWFLRQRNYEVCGPRELKEFFLYLRHGHEQDGGRWGNKRLITPPRPETVKDYRVCLNTFFKWLVSGEMLTASPMAKIPKSQVR